MLASLLSGLAFAQEPSVLLRGDDSYPGTQAIRRIDSVNVSATGDWMVSATTHDPEAESRILIANGELRFQSNKPCVIDSQTGLCGGAGGYFTDLGDPVHLCLFQPLGGNMELTLVWDDHIVLRAGESPVTASGVPAGAVWETFYAWVNGNRSALLIGRLDSGSSCAVRIEFDPGGTITSQSLLAIEGSQLPGAGHVEPVDLVSNSYGASGINNAGDVWWQVRDESGASNSNDCCNEWIYLNETPLTQEGTPSIIGSVGPLFGSKVTFNDQGDWLCLRPNPQGTASLLFNETFEIARAGASLPWTPGAGALFSVLPIGLGDTGTWAYTAVYESSPHWGVYRHAIVVDDEPVVSTDGTMIGGLPVSYVNTHPLGSSFSRNGRFLAFIAATSAYPWGAVFLHDFDPDQIGASFCAAQPNSTGAPGRIEAFEVGAQGSDNVLLRGSQLPPQVFGVFVVSSELASTPIPLGAGHLCLSGTIGRYSRPGEIFSADASGVVTMPVDLAAIPQASAVVAAQAGDTWRFQAWYRDVMNGAPVANLTEGVAITIQ